ncbi:MAG: TetR/AcrR family transcriptional regulator [Flavobacteriales bacterium]
MNKILAQINFSIAESLSAKNPIGSEIGQEILRKSSQLIERDGIDLFTFKKLAIEMGSTESTIYRYFGNKHQLLLYLSSWYWNLLEVKLAFMTSNVNNPTERLDLALQFLGHPIDELSATSFLDERVLHQIVVRDSTKSINALGMSTKKNLEYLDAYVNLIKRLSEIIHKVNPRYKFPNALSISLLETSHYQNHLQSILPGVSDLDMSPKNTYRFLHQLAFTALENNA